MYVLKHLIFEVQPPRSADLNTLDFYLCRYSKPYYLAPTENENTLHQRKFCAWKTILNRPKTFENVRQSMIMCVHAFMHGGEGNFEYLMWVVTGSTIESPH